MSMAGTTWSPVSVEEGASVEKGIRGSDGHGDDHRSLYG
jgi:hypothetical protein